MDEKVCTKCNQSKPLTEFGAKAGRKNSRCRPCLVEISKEHYRAHPQPYKDRANVVRKQRHPENRQKIWGYLREHPCVDCGLSNPVVLEFDHRDPTEKSFTIATVVTWKNWEEIEREIEKCDVRCANCHRIKTAVQFNYYQS